MNNRQEVKIISKLLLSAMLCTGATTYAQSKIGDFIESTSYNIQSRGQERQLSYRPIDNAFVSFNGKNRYTRALYSNTCSDFRLETSDRPVFATFKRNDMHNICFLLEVEGKTYSLDSLTSCRAVYDCARRTYTLKDNCIGNAELHISVLMAADREEALWQIAMVGNKNPKEVGIIAKLSPIARPKLNRRGDIGVDPYGSFEASTKRGPEAISHFVLTDTLYLSFATGTKKINTNKELQNKYLEAEKHRQSIAQNLVISTPEPWLNAVGGALSAAVEGIWDGETWLHGAVGWRMPLAGWRAGYTGDLMGMPSRAQSHFDAYANSMVTDVEPTLPHPTQDPKTNMARAIKQWGTQMYSNGYISRFPNQRNNMHHYDMNLNYIDELLDHFDFDARPETLRRYWTVIKSHLAWEKRNYDPDNDGLYDAYCCIWASDALYYSGGAVTHSTAYNLRAFRAAARIAEILSEDPTPYQKEADKIQRAIDAKLWMADKGYWAEYLDYNEANIHADAALWSVYTPIDCHVGSESQRLSATRYVDQHIPHIPVKIKDYDGSLGNIDNLCTISTSDWMPYSWSINNVACAEVMNTALAYFEAGRPDEGYKLFKANAVDNMYVGSSPGNFGQISFYDVARGECYRDFGDAVGVACKTLIRGLFGVHPSALDGTCTIAPSFPAEWDSASFKTSYLDYTFKRCGDTCIFDIEQHFAEPLQMSVAMLSTNGDVTKKGNKETKQRISLICPRRKCQSTTTYTPPIAPTNCGGTELSSIARHQQFVDLKNLYNDSVTNIFKPRYLSPRPKTTTLQIPTQGIGEWCHPLLTAEIEDDALRNTEKGVAKLSNGLQFKTPQVGNNVVFVSKWDNFPTEITIPISTRAGKAYLLIAGSTNHMQTQIANAAFIATYTDGTQDTLLLVPPFNYCPIEQDYYVDGMAFQTTMQRPLRFGLKDGQCGEELTKDKENVYGRYIEGGAAQVLVMNLDKKKKLSSIRLQALANDVVVGLLGLTLTK